MSIREPYSEINMQEATEVIARIGDKVTVLVQGHMGCGKTAILKELALKYPGHMPCYVDITTKDVGDFTIPSIQVQGGVTIASFVPNEEFGFQNHSPVIIMLDELGKASKAVMNACLRLMLERKLGVHELPEGSIVFATTNLSSEGVGDTIPAHARNRICTVKMRKPTADEWRFNFAHSAGVDPVVIATAVEYPTMLASYEDYERVGQNDYIYDPRAPMAAFVTPRSLERASDILKTCKDLPREVLTHVLTGVVGKRAAMDMINMLVLDYSLPTWIDITAAPTSAAVPTNGAGACLLVSKALMNIKANTLDSWMAYVQRLPKEAQALFAISALKEKSIIRNIVVTNKEFTAWAVSNGYLFS